jgi:hypothetical protein
MTGQPENAPQPFDPEKTDTLDLSQYRPPSGKRKSGFPFLRVLSWAFILVGIAVLVYAVATK